MTLLAALSGVVKAAASWKEAAFRCVASWIPFHVVSVDHFEADDGSLTSPLFRLFSKGAWRWASSHHLTMFAPDAGFYKIRTWNPHLGIHEHFFLSAQHLSEALQLRGLKSWWAMTDFGICVLLSSYMLNMSKMYRKDSHAIFAITIDGKDATPLLKPYLSSLMCRNNATAESVCALYYHLIGQDHHGDAEDAEHDADVAAAEGEARDARDAKKHDRANSVTITDFNLEETTFKGEQMLFA